MRSYIGFILFLILSFDLIAREAQKEIIQPTDQPISLSGVLRIVHGFGPPGYGEDKKVDIKISYWVLELPYKLTVACTPSSPDLVDIQCGSTDRIRLFFPIEPVDNDVEVRAKKLLGHKTIVTGILQRRTSMIEITPVYMNVVDIEAVNSHSK